MIKKVLLLLALIIAPGMVGMDVVGKKAAANSAYGAKLTRNYVTCYPGSNEQKIAKLNKRISKLDGKIAAMEKAPRALDKWGQIEFYELEIQAAWEAIDIITSGPQVSELEKSVERLTTAQSHFRNFVKYRSEAQKSVEYFNKHDKSEKQPMSKLPFSQSEWELSAGILSDDPEAETKIAAQLQALEKDLEKTTDPKKQARIADQLAWTKVQQKIARMAKK